MWKKLKKKRGKEIVPFIRPLQKLKVLGGHVHKSRSTCGKGIETYTDTCAVAIPEAITNSSMHDWFVNGEKSI
jgi:hypothetical protein